VATDLKVWLNVYKDDCVVAFPYLERADNALSVKNGWRIGPAVQIDLIRTSDGFKQDDSEAIKRIRASLQARAEGRNEGGDVEIMRSVDAIVLRARIKGLYEAAAIAASVIPSMLIRSKIGERIAQLEKELQHG